MFPPILRNLLEAVVTPLFQPRVLVVLLTVGFFLPLWGCTTNQPTIDPERNKISITPFGNASVETTVEDELTQVLVRDLMGDGRLDVVARKEADAELQGQVTSYNRTAMIYDRRDRVQQYRLRIRANIRLVDPETDEEIWSADGLYRQTTYSDRQPPEESEDFAQARVVDQLSQALTHEILTEWPYVEE